MSMMRSISCNLLPARAATAQGLPRWDQLWLVHHAERKVLFPPSSANFARKPSFKCFPALLLLSIWLGICCESWGIHFTGFLADGRPSFLLEELNILHQVLEHPPLWMKSVGSCVFFRVGAHLALICIWYLGQTLGSVLFHPDSPTL